MTGKAIRRLGLHLSSLMKLVLPAMVGALALATAHAQDSEFPGREKYQTVKVITTADLRAQREQYLVIDVRSKFEYETLQITNSLLLPLSNPDFAKVIPELWSKVKGQGIKGIVFYCNGKTCFKSYKAAVKAQKAGVNDVLAYDAGIFDWAQAHPDQAALLGESPLDPSKLISKADFEARCLQPQEFAKRVSRSTSVLDVRDPHQSGGVALFTGFQRSIELKDMDKIKRFVQRAMLRGKTVMAYDNVGKQVRWLQYYFEQLKVPEYHFMCGGAKKFFETLGQ